MTSRDFCYWLMGMLEISGNDLKFLDEKQIEIIKRHLNMVFVHEIDPSFPDKETLQQIHDEGVENMKIMKEKKQKQQTFCLKPGCTNITHDLCLYCYEHRLKSQDHDLSRRPLMC